MQPNAKKVDRILFRKIISSYIVALLLLSSMTIFFNDTAKAAEPNPNDLWVAPQTLNVTIGDIFYTDIGVAVWWEINNVTISNITFQPPGILNYTNTAQGDLFIGGNWFDPEPLGINNASGWASNLSWINNTGENLSGIPYTVANITWWAYNVGTVNIGLFGSTSNNGGINHTTTIYNGTVIVHPRGPTNFFANQHNSTQINLTWNLDLGVDNVVIRGKADSPPVDMIDGYLVYNGTGTNCIDTGLSPGTHYYYKAWGWNASANLYCMDSEVVMADNTTVDIVVIENVPDANQPPANPYGVDISSWCSGVSAANVIWYYNLTGNSSAYNITNSFNISEIAAYIGWFMNTNDHASQAPLGTKGSPNRDNPGVSGTLRSDILPGFREYIMWNDSYELDNPSDPDGKFAYFWDLSFFNDTMLTLMQAWDNYTNEIDAGRPVILSFGYWNPISETPSPLNVTFYGWGAYETGYQDSEQGVFESWENDGVGHTVTGVGYIDNYDPDGPGVLPFGDWVIVHDNWPATGDPDTGHVAVPWDEWEGMVKVKPQGGSLPPAPQINSSFGGTVDNTQGNLLENVNIAAYNTTLGWLNSTFSDGDGQYNIGVFSGWYNISAEKNGYDTLAQDIYISQNEFYSLNITLSSTAILGYVKDQYNNTIGGATVQISKQGGGYNDQTLTDSNGYYDFRDLEAGTYDLQSYKENVFQNEYANNIIIYDDETKWVNFSAYVQDLQDIYFHGYVYQDYTPEIPVPGATVKVITDKAPYTDVRNSTTTNNDGYFEMYFTPNQTAVYSEDIWDVRINITKNYYYNPHGDHVRYIEDPKWNEIDDFRLTKIWNITAYAKGYVYLNDNVTPIENADVYTFSESNFFYNETKTAPNGSFLIGLYSDANNNEFEFRIQKKGHFVNETDIVTINDSEIYNLSIIHLELRPEENSSVRGNITCGGQPLAFMELELFDPAHPFESEKEDLPRTNETGFYNLSTYAGDFLLITYARVIGLQKDGPPLAIGGYQNEIAQVTVRENGTVWKDLTLTTSVPDVFQADVDFVQWNQTIVNMSRTVKGNSKLLRYMSDYDLDDNISALEAEDLREIVNDSITGDAYDMELLLVYMPLEFMLDGTDFVPVNANVEIAGLIGPTNSTDPITIYVNNTVVVANGQINNSAQYHSMDLLAYYANPAFNTTYTLHFPNGYNVTNAVTEMVDISGIGTPDVTATPYDDPDWNDTDFYEDVYMLVSNVDSFASFNQGYSYNNPMDSDGNNRYNYLMRKVKFNTSNPGTFKTEASLRSSSGKKIDEWSGENSYETGENIVQFSFEGEEIYRKGINGSYNVVVNLFYKQDGGYIWLDSISQDTPEYTYTEFDQPPIFFTGSVSDYGLDLDNDTLYDYLVFSLEVDVGDPDDYRFEGEIEVEVFEGGFDSWVGRAEKIISFYSTGIQTVNLSFDGSAINSKGVNASIWADIEVRRKDYWERLDEIEHRTQKYFYDDFAPEPPENSSVMGLVTDVFDTTLDARVKLKDELRFEDNETQTNNGNYSINAKPGICRLQVECTNNSYYLDNHEEIVILDTNESLTRNITLLPAWYQSGGMEWMLEDFQYQEGELIHFNITTNKPHLTMMPNSGSTLEVYKEYELEGKKIGEEFITSMSNTTDSNGEVGYVINTSGFSTGWYMFEIWIYNQSFTPKVARGDVHGIQISSMSLDFELNKHRYRKGDTASFDYNLTDNNGTLIQNADFEWKIMYWDWTEHVIASGTFSSATGYGTKPITIPSTVQNDKWYEVQLEATTENGTIVSWDGFEATTGSVVESVSDEPLGSQGSYEALLLNVTVDVTQAGSYRLESGLHNQNWKFIAHNETQQYLSTIGSHNITIYFDGETIRSSSKDGPYNAWVGLFKMGEWDPLDDLEYTTSMYNYTDFAVPPIRFNTSAGITYYKIGAVGDYESLQINFTINASQPGNYSIHGNLHKRTWYGDWWEGEGVAWNCTDIEIIDGVNNDTDLNINITFEGTDIHNSGQGGPYNINLNLHKGFCNSTGEWITFFDPSTPIHANYTEFKKPSAVVENITDNGSINGNLVIGVHVNVTNGNDGIYKINGMLHSSEQDGHVWITETRNQTNLNNGTNIVNLTFNGDEIYSKGYNGPYRLDIELKRIATGDWLGWKEFETDPHNYTDFSQPGALFNGTPTDQGFDLDGDGYYDFLRVSIPVAFIESGNYELSGEIFKEDGYDWEWITWANKPLPEKTAGTNSIVKIDFNGNEIANKGFEGYYGVNLWLRNTDQGKDIGNIEFTTNDYYYVSNFDQPSVSFTDDSPISESLSSDGKYIYVNVTVNSSEIGTYYIHADLHKVISYEGWDDWVWLTPGDAEVTFDDIGELNVSVPFSTAMIQSSGYDGSYMVNLELKDNSWMTLDTIFDYETGSYLVADFADTPIYFTGNYSDSLYPTSSPEYVKLDVTVNVTEAGTYNINGDLHKISGWNWNFIAGSGIDETLSVGEQNVTLYFDAVEILDNIEGLGLSEFGSGENFDIDVWVRRSGEWSDLDHLGTVQSENTYSVGNFTSSLGANIESVVDNGYNITNNNEAPIYEYLNVTITVNFSQAGDYEIWCDLGKDDGVKWHWIGWKNKYQTISAPQVKDITLQFSGERINSVGKNGSYNLYMEIQNLDTGKRVDRYDGQTTIAYDYNDFVGSQVGFVDGTESAVGIDTNDAGGEYDYLLVSVNVSAQQAYSNVELRGDLRKQVINGPDQWISWENNWTSLPTGESTITLQFDGEIIRNSEIDGPYQVRIELWDMDEWKLLDAIDRIDTPAYSYDNFQAPSASFIEVNFEDWGNDTDDSDSKYNYLDINCSVNCNTVGTYEVTGELFYDIGGWKWIGWTSEYVSLAVGVSTVKLQFEGTQIRNKGIDGKYKARIELMDSSWRTIDSYDPYITESYNADDFQTSGAEFVTASVDDRIKDSGDYLDINVTVSVATNGTYWIGADLHRQIGWDWDWIAFNSKEQYLDNTQDYNITILFSGQAIRSSGIDGPYHVRLELRDTTTWTEQDLIEKYTTGSYLTTDFSEPAVSFIEDNFEDWGNDTDDSDSKYNYLEINVSLNCTETGTFWLHADLHKKTDYNWQWITWKGQDIEITQTGVQTVKLQFDGETIKNRAINGSYSVRLEIINTSDWTRLDTVEEYNTNTYTYGEFQNASITFVDANTEDWGNDTDGDGQYNYLDINLTINCSQTGTYWLGADLSKITGHTWQWIAWKGQEITISQTGEQNVRIQFDGTQLRNKGIDGPYSVRVELNSVGGTFKQYDVIDNPRYTTSSYSYTDFESAGVELVDLTDTTADAIVNGNLQVNVSVNASTTGGKYEIIGDLFYESGYTWDWITWTSIRKDITNTGVTTFKLTFDGGDIYEAGIDDNYNVRIELRNVGTGNLIDTIEKYTTKPYNNEDFSAPSATIDDTGDYQKGNDLQINVSAYSADSDTYQISGVLHGSNYEFIAWTSNTTTVNGEQNVSLLFDGSLINNSGVDPAKVYVEMRKTSNWKLMDSLVKGLDNSYNYDDFGANVVINTSSVYSTVWDDPGDADGYNDSLNFSVNITFSTAGSYKISAGLKDQNGTWITGTDLGLDFYSGLETINLSFSGLKIYMKGLNGPYTLSFISVAKSDGMEIAKAKNAHTTVAYDYDIFEHPSGTMEQATFTGTYSSYAWDSDSDTDYDYLVVNVTIYSSATVGSHDYDLYGDLYSSDGSKWIAAASNSSIYIGASGSTVATLEFDGYDIYTSLIDGPYLVGYLRVGALVDTTWILLDEADDAHTTASYSYSDFDTEAPMSPINVTSVNVSNDPFSPNNDGAYDNTLITVVANADQTLYVNIYNSTNVLKRTGMSLNESASGTYTATWHGKDDTDNVVADDTHTIKVTDEATGDQSNESAEEATTVMVDTAAPTVCSVEIKSGDTYTNTTSVNLTTITATDNSSTEMRFKNAGGNWTSWQNFQGSRSWTLFSGDGSKTVYYEARDVANNTISSPVSDSITLDTTKPTVNLTITGKGDTPSTHTNNVSVTLSITGSDATSGVEYMKISNNIGFAGASWVDYNTSKEWTLNSGDGVKTVYIKVKDRAGKESDTSSDNITLDTIAPTSLTISIESGQTYTNSTTVTLTLSANNATKMQISNYSNFTGAAWESYSTSKNWSILDGNGTRTVYFKAKDTAGNIATAVNDTIILDKKAPAISSVSSSGVSTSSATITWDTDEAATSYVEYGTTISYGLNTTLNTTKVMSHSETLTGLSSGTTYHYRVKSKDSAGNEKTSSDDTFTTTSGGDTTPPDAITGLAVSDKINAERTLTISWNQSNAPDFAGYYIYRKANASFINVSASGVQKIKTITSRTTTTYDDNTSVDDYTYHYAVVAFDTASPPNYNQTVTSVSGTSIDDKAPTTTDNIDPGWYTTEKTVILTATDNGKGVDATKCKIYPYGGNASSYSYSNYTMPFTVGGENTYSDGRWNISYYSVDANTTPNVESLNNVTLKVDTVDPSTSDNAPVGWQTSSVSVTLTSVDATSGVNKIYYTKDGSTPTIASSQYSSPILFSSDGNKTLKYFARDNATNSESVKTTNMLIDATRPTSSINALSTYSTIPFNVTWGSSDATSGIKNVTIQYKNGSGSWTDWLTGQAELGTASFTNGAVGYTYYFRSVAIDNASNQENVTGYDAYTTVLTSVLDVDITSPVDATDGLSDGLIHVSGTITITGTASGANFTKYWLNYSADQINWTNIANDTTPVLDGTLGILDTTGLSDGSYTVELMAVNVTSNNSINITILVDNTAPNITSGPSTSNIDTNSAKISWNTNESANATVEYGTTTAYDSTKSSSPLSFVTSHSETLTGLSDDTTYHYRVLSYDKAGNMVNSSDKTFTTESEDGGEIPPGGYTGDDGSDVTADAGGPYSGYVGEAIDFDGSNSEGAIITYTWDFGDDSTETGETVTHSYSAAGTYTVTLTVEDENETTDDDETTVTITEAPDTTPPTVSNVYRKPTKADSTDTVKIYATVTDDYGIKSVTLYYDDGTTENSAEMTVSSGDIYRTSIGPFSVGTTVEYTVEAYDYSNNDGRSGEQSFTVVNPPTVITVDNLSIGETQEITEDELEGTDLVGVKVKSGKDLKDIEIIVEQLEEGEVEGKPTVDNDTYIYGYLEINVTAENQTLADEDIEITILFKIELEWLDENDIDKEKVVLKRLKDGEWLDLPTTYLVGQDNDTHAYYEAIATGTSTFAIVGSKVTEISKPTDDGEDQPLPWPMIIVGIIVAMILLIAFLFKTGYLYIEHEEEIKQPKPEPKQPGKKTSKSKTSKTSGKKKK